MPYDPNFIPGFDVPLPTLGVHTMDSALNGGVPIDHQRFSIVFNQDRGFAIVTAHNIDGSTLIAEGEIPRRDRFRNDPDVSRQLQVDNDRGYRGRHNPWDRGHLVRRRAMHWGDPDVAVDADRESFFWTNIAPQHRRLHSSAWGKIENWMLDAADSQERRSCVFTGPIFTIDDPEIVNLPSERPVRIPAGYWKIFAITHQQRLRAAAFLVWQRDFDRPEPAAFDPILEQVRVTTVEHLTGLSFLTLRAADPLHFGAGVQPASTARRPTTAARRAAAAAPRDQRPLAINSAADILL